MTQLNKDESRDYIGLFVFTENYILEAKNFVSDTDLDVTYVINSVDYMRMQFRKFEPGQPATRASRFKVGGYLVSELDFELKASGKNCEKLWEICRVILVRNWANKPDGGP